MDFISSKLGGEELGFGVGLSLNPKWEVGGGQFRSSSKCLARIWQLSSSLRAIFPVQGLMKFRLGGVYLERFLLKV